MAAIEFQCPKCMAPLRARDQSFAGREISCPDCGAVLLIEAEANGGLFARVKQQAPVPPPKPKLAPVAAPPAEPVPEAPQRALFLRRETLWDKLKTPTGKLIAAVTLAFTAVIVSMVVVWLRGDEEPTPPANITEVPEPKVDEKPEAPQVDRAEIERPFLMLGEQIAKFHELQQIFPAQISDPVLLPHESLSWMAVLLENQSPGARPPLWDRPWNDPLNDDFSRQEIRGFLNPAIAETRTNLGYPVTHFVGIAGVGADAKDLPHDDPKMGIFGSNRIVSTENVPDGLSNTWMVSGVQKQLGPWAAGETPTIRSLTQQPYVNGPDGLGTGETDAMTILMADGSVRSVDANIDPSILEQLATVNDGLPLPAAEPSPPKHEQPVVPETPESAAPPVAVAEQPEPPLVAPRPIPNVVDALLAQIEQLPKTPPPEPIDIDARLSQEVNFYRQPNDVKLMTLLDEFEEMVGVPIFIEESVQTDFRERLDRGIKLSLTKPTLRQILEELLRPMGLAFRLGMNQIEIIPAEP